MASSLSLLIDIIPVIAVIIAVIACFYASYSDIKRGIIPNKLTFPLIGLGLILDGIYAFISWNFLYILLAGIITGVIFVLGYVFWRLGAWAGGDVKLFTALAALIPFYPLFIKYTINNVQFPIYTVQSFATGQSVYIYIFPLTVIINSILSMLPFLLIYVIYVAFKTKPHLIGELISPVKEYRKNFVLTLVVTSAVTLTVFITPYLPFQILLVFSIMVFLLSLVISKLPNQFKAVFVSLVTVFALFNNLQVTITGIIVIFLLITVVDIVRKLLFKVSKEALQNDYKIVDLKEGMIPAYNLYEKDDKVFYDDKGFIQKIKEAIASGDLSIVSMPPGKLLVSNLAAGLKDDDIELLKKLSSEGKLGETFRVKKGVPFAPSIFIGLLISLFIGDLAIIFLKVLYWLQYAI